MYKMPFLCFYANLTVTYHFVKPVHKTFKICHFKDIILPSTSEFVGTIKDLTGIANAKEAQSGRRDALGSAYNPDCLDFLEDSKDFKIEKVFEFCPNE